MQFNLKAKRMFEGTYISKHRGWSIAKTPRGISAASPEGTNRKLAISMIEGAEAQVELESIIAFAKNESDNDKAFNIAAGGAPGFLPQVPEIDGDCWRCFPCECIPLRCQCHASAHVVQACMGDEGNTTHPGNVP